MILARRFLQISLLLLSMTALSLAQQRDSMLQFQLSDQLKQSAVQWNRGDLDGFLADYLDSEEMTFTSGGSILKGHDALEQRYRKSYGESVQNMGTLSFSDIEVWRLGETQALVVGRWKLSRDQVDKGVFSLVMVKVGDKWKIMHDHTSASKSP